MSLSLDSCCYAPNSRNIQCAASQSRPCIGALLLTCFMQHVASNINNSPEQP